MTESVLAFDDQPVAGAASSVETWKRAWWEFVHFEGDPVATLESVNADDERFVLGPVFVAMYSIMGGLPAAGDVIATAARRAHDRLGTSPREQAFVAAMDHLIRGEFTKGASVLDAWARVEADFAAVRIAHDIALHIGDNPGRLRSSSQAMAKWEPDHVAASFVAGMHAFALGEVGDLDAAERVGRSALDADPLDLWARHALVHVFETRNDVTGSIAFLVDAADMWSRQDALATHIWWHLALRHLATGDVGAVFDIYDTIIDDATSVFRLSDVTSLLWRLELAGHDVGARWTVAAAGWTAAIEQHTCAFLDVHAAMALARSGDADVLRSWSDRLDATWNSQNSEYADTFCAVVRPLVRSIEAFAVGDLGGCVALLDAVAPSTYRIGGSNAQRDIFDLTRRTALARHNGEHP